MAIDLEKYRKASTTPERDLSKYRKPAAALPAPKKSLTDTVLDAGTKVSDFLGFKGVADQYGATIARATVPQEQKQYVENPSLKQVLGSAAQGGANFIPGAGVGASVARKAGIGALTGYAIDAGGDLQAGKSLSETVKPGAATAVGTVLPILGRITGLSNTGKAAKARATKLEELNLRLTPVEKQNLEKQGKQIAEYLAEKKIVGTPAQRFGKVNALYDDMERQITRVVDGSGVQVPKSEIIERLKRIPEQYADNLSEYDAVVAKVGRMIQTLQDNAGDAISATRLNNIKRAEWKNAYAKNNTDVINDVSNEVGHAIKGILDERIKPLASLNDEYGKVIAARRALFKATSRNQAGLFSKAAGAIGGASIGGALGSGTGVLVGSYVGPKVVNAVSTPARSAIGAGFQTAGNAINKIPAAARGKVQPIRKALLQSLPRGDD